jgi:excisionase family DNA binding protein
VSDKLIDYNERLLTPEELSKWLNIKLSTIYKWSAMGYIPCVKLGGKVRGSVRFVRLEVQTWLRRKSRRGRSTYRLEAGSSDFSYDHEK